MQRFLIIEDETPAYNKLSGLLRELIPEGFTHDWAKSKVVTRGLLSEVDDYDLIFSDIQLSDGLAFEVFAEFSLQCPIIFCTAYNDYLQEAFKVNGIAYLLKPFNKGQLAESLQKYETLFPPAPKVLNDLRKAVTRQRTYKDRLVIKDRGKIHLLPVDQISLIEAKSDVCRIVRGDGKAFLHSISLGALSEQMDSELFFRINRSQMVRIDQIQTIEPYFKNRLALKMAGHPEVIHTSSAVTAGFRAWLEG